MIEQSFSSLRNCGIDVTVSPFVQVEKFAAHQIKGFLAAIPCLLFFES